jgi:hypothetical protein
LPNNSIIEIQAAMASQIQSRLCGTADPLIEQLTVYEMMQLDPTVPAIDFLPADPFTERIGMGSGNHQFNILIRARVNTPDSFGAQEQIYSMMDTREPTSVEGAIDFDPTLGGKVEDAEVVSVTGWTTEPSTNAEGSYLGCRWTVRITP